MTRPTMGEELTAKKNICRGHRAATTRLLGEVNTAVTAECIERTKMGQLKRSLENKLQVLTGLDEEILGMTHQENLEEEIIQVDQVRDGIYLALSKVELAMTPDHCPVGGHDTGEPATGEPDTAGRGTATTQGTEQERPAETRRTKTTGAATPGPNLKLPKISLP